MKTLNLNLKYLSTIIAAALLSLASIPVVRAEIPAVDFKASATVFQITKTGVLAKIRVWKLGAQVPTDSISRIGGGGVVKTYWGYFEEEPEIIHIAGDFPTAVDGQKLGDLGLHLSGRYQYTAVTGAVKTIREFSVVPIPEIKEPPKPLGAGSSLNTPSNSKPLGGGSALDAPKKKNR